MWACNVSPLPFLPVGFLSRKGTETLRGGKERAAQNGSHSSSHACCLKAREDMKGSGAGDLFLGYSNCREAFTECHLQSELEQTCSWLAVAGASRRMPSFSPLFCMPLCSWLHPNCHEQICRHGLSSPTYCCFQTWSLCRRSSEWFLLLSLLFWGPEGSCWAPLLFRQQRNCVLQLLTFWLRADSSVCQLFCLCWAQLAYSSVQAGRGGYVHSLPSATPPRPLSPIFMWWVWT